MSGSLVSWIRNNVKAEDIKKLVDENKDEALDALKRMDKDQIKGVLDEAAHKLDNLADQETKDGSVSKSVLGFFSNKGSSAPIKTSSSSDKSLKSKAVSLAIRNWRYTLSFLMSAFYWFLAWSCVLIIILPIYWYAKKRMGVSKKKQ